MSGATDGLAFELPGGGRALFTERRHGNMSPSGDDTSSQMDASVGGEGSWDGAQARERLGEQIGLAHLIRGYQEHGTRVQRVRTLPREEPPDAEGPRADGQATALRGVGAMVLAADCLPVALGCSGAVAMIHAGWRGLAAGVLEQGVLAVRELSGEEPIVAVVGPGAGVCCYEVGPELHDAFADAHSRDRHLDLRAIAHERLLAAGVRQVRDLDACTICDTRFFSHRREGANAGRQAGVAWLSS
jgi:YfiH family protein